MSGEIKKRKGKGKDKGIGSSVSDESPKKKKEVKIKDVAKDKMDGGKIISPQESADPPPKFGPMPALSPHRLWSRVALISGLMVVVWWNGGNKGTTPIATVEEDIRYKGMKVKCSPEFEKEIMPFKAKDCVPKHCGRLVTDDVISSEEVYALNDLVERSMKSADKASTIIIFDLSSGLLKYADKTLDVYKMNKTKDVFNRGDQLVFQSVKTKLMRTVSSYFGVDYWALHLAYPVYFSRISKVRESRKKDEYWHNMVHKDNHPSFDYSTMIFLSDYKKDVEGGRLIFVDGDNANRTVESKKGRAIAFTSGSENKLFNEQVSRGSRVTFTLGFTCDEKKGKKDPL